MKTLTYKPIQTTELDIDTLLVNPLSETEKLVTFDIHRMNEKVANFYCKNIESIIENTISALDFKCATACEEQKKDYSHFKFAKLSLGAIGYSAATTFLGLAANLPGPMSLFTGTLTIVQTHVGYNLFKENYTDLVPRLYQKRARKINAGRKSSLMQLLKVFQQQLKYRCDHFAVIEKESRLSIMETERSQFLSKQRDDLTNIRELNLSLTEMQNKKTDLENQRNQALTCIQEKNLKYQESEEKRKKLKNYYAEAKEGCENLSTFNENLKSELIMSKKQLDESQSRIDDLEENYKKKTQEQDNYIEKLKLTNQQQINDIDQRIDNINQGHEKHVSSIKYVFLGEKNDLEGKIEYLSKLSSQLAQSAKKNDCNFKGYIPSC